MNQQHLRGRVVTHVGLTVLALIFAGLVPFGFNLLVGRAYGSAVLGGISVVLGLALFLGQVPSTVGIAATKFMAEALGRGDESEARAIFQFLFTLNLGLTALLTGAMVVAAPWIHRALHVPVGAVLLGAVLLLLYSLYLFLKSVYYGTQQVGAYVWNEVISDLAFFALLVAVFVVRASSWLLLPFVLNNAIFAGIAGYQLRPYFRHFRWVAPAGRIAILHYWVVNGLGSAASIGRAALGTTVAGLFLSHQAVGLYAAAAALTAPLQLMPRALALVLFSTMARLHGAGRASSVRELLDLSTEWLVLALGLLCGLLIVNATAVLAILFHRPEYAQATTAAQLVVFGAYLLMISSPAISALSSTTYVWIPTLASLLGLGTSLALWLLLIPPLGINGAGLGFAAGSVITGSIPAFFAYRLIGIRRVRFLRLGAILAALVAVLLTLERIPLVASAVFVIVLALVYVRPGLSLVHAALHAYRAWALRRGGEVRAANRPSRRRWGEMELTEYWGVMRRWSLLVIGGTLAATLLGGGLWLRDRSAAQPRYVGTASVLVRYVTPPGVTGTSVTDTSMSAVLAEAEVLSKRVHDAGALRRGAAQAHVAPSQVQQVSTAIDLGKPLITVRVVAGTPQAAAVAQGMAEYLVQVETEREQARAAVLSRTVAREVARAQQRWREAQADYYLVCGCIAGQHHATVDPATLARLRFGLGRLRAAYRAAAERSTALQTNAVPVAIAMPGAGGPLTRNYPSSLQTVLPAAVLGVLVSMGLASLLDSNRAGRRPARVHALQA